MLGTARQRESPGRGVHGLLPQHSILLLPPFAAQGIGPREVLRYCRQGSGPPPRAFAWLVVFALPLSFCGSRAAGAEELCDSVYAKCARRVRLNRLRLASIVFCGGVLRAGDCLSRYPCFWVCDIMRVAQSAEPVVRD